MPSSESPGGVDGVEPLGDSDPRHVGSYELTGRLGIGGMGRVYLGVGPGGRAVAVKVIREDLVREPEFLARFRREAEMAQRVARFCTAEVLDVDVDGPAPYLVTEYLDGPTLHEAVARDGPMADADLERVAVAVASALVAIHAAGMVHRDLKPSNVLLSRLGPRVIDFGIARALDATTMITQSVHILGTPAFMAPEQARAEEVTQAADVYAWGALVTYAGTGTPPAGKGPSHALLYRTIHEPPILDGLHPSLRPIVEQTLAKDPAARPTAAGLLRSLLDADAGELDTQLGALAGNIDHLPDTPHAQGVSTPPDPGEVTDGLSERETTAAAADPPEKATGRPPATAAGTITPRRGRGTRLRRRRNRRLLIGLITLAVTLAVAVPTRALLTDPDPTSASRDFASAAARNQPLEACPPTSGVSPDEIEIGLILPDTGADAGLFSAAQAGVQARISTANAEGGVYGRTITLNWRDDESRPEANLVAARELVESEQVLGIVEMTTAATGGAGYLRDLGVPVTGLAAEAVWADHPNMFSAQSIVSGDGTGVDTWGRYVKGQGGTKAILLENQVSASTTAITKAMGVSMEATGVEIAGAIDFTPGFSNPVQVANRIVASGADTVAGALPPRDFAMIVAALHDLGAPPKVALSATGYDQSVLAEFGARIAGESVFISYWPFEEDLPAHRMFLDGMAKYAPSLQQPSDSMALRAYVAADLMVRGLEEVGPCPTREAFITTLRGVDDFDGAGLLPMKLDLSASFGLPNTCYIFVRVAPSGSRFETVDPSPLCGTSLPSGAGAGG